MKCKIKSMYNKKCIEYADFSSVITPECKRNKIIIKMVVNGNVNITAKLESDRIGFV